MHPRVKTWRKIGVLVGRTPSGADGINLHSGVGAAVFVEPGKGHDRSVAQIGHRRIPASMSHSLHVSEYASSRIIDGAKVRSMERIVLLGTSVDEGPPIRQNHDTVAEHIP